MFQKAKYVLAGLVAGVVLSTTALAYAADQSIKLIVNGQEIQCDVSPQNIDGRVLVPARYVAEALGATVGWDGEQQAVTVTSNAPGQNLLEEPVQDQVPEEPAKEGSNIQMHWQVLDDGVEYWLGHYLVKSYLVDGTTLYSKGYTLLYDEETNTMYLAYNDKPGHPVNNYKTILESIPFKVFNDQSYIAKDYFENTILPLIK